MLLTGDPGIGKSHIALALQEQVQADSHTILRYFCSAHHTNSVLFPFVGQLERAARFKRGDSPAQKLSKLKALLVQSGIDGDDTLAVLANLLSVPLEGRSGLPELSPQSRKEKTLAAILAQLERLAAIQHAIFPKNKWFKSAKGSSFTWLPS